jgi:hypothetical protein
VEQRHLFESNVVSLSEYRQRRESAPADGATPRSLHSAPRPPALRSIAHQARMLAHLEKIANPGR